MNSEKHSDVFSCTLCFKQFRHLRNVKEHEKICQSESNHDGQSHRNGVICPDCNQVFGRLDSLRIHVEESHEIPQEVESLHFESKNEFEKWKKKIEKENLCFYSTKRSIKSAGVKRNYLYCHRTGFFKSRSKGHRRIKSQGSNKLDATCTSAMVVTELPRDEIEVVFHKTHFGHEIYSVRQNYHFWLHQWVKVYGIYGGLDPDTWKAVNNNPENTTTSPVTALSPEIHYERMMNLFNKNSYCCRTISEAEKSISKASQNTEERSIINILINPYTDRKPRNFTGLTESKL